MLAEHFHNANYQSVVRSYNTAEFDPGDFGAQDLLSVPASFYQLGLYSDAVESCVNLFAYLADVPEFYSTYGASLRRTGAYQKSEEVFKAALEKYPRSEIIANNYANLLIDLGRTKEAIGVLEAVLERDPSYADASLNLARARSILNAGTAGLENPRKSSGVTTSTLKDPQSVSDPSYDPLLAAFSTEEILDARIQSKGTSNQPGLDRIKSAITDLSKTIDALGDVSCEELSSLADILTLHQPVKALRYCNSIQKKYGMLPRTYRIAGSAYLTLQKFGDAELSFTIARNLGSDDPAVLVNLASLCLMRGDYLLSSFYYECLKRDNPGYQGLHKLKEQLNDFEASPDKGSAFFQMPASGQIQKLGTFSQADDLR